MAVRKINESTLTAIGNAIRSKTGGSALINPEDMADEIESIQTGGGIVIPSEYQRCEYIEANNAFISPYILFNYSPTSIEVDAMYLQTASAASIIAGFSADPGNWFGIDTSGNISVGGGVSLAQSWLSRKTVKATIDSSQRTITVECGEESNTRENITVNTSKSIIFLGTDINENYSRARIFYTKIYNSKYIIEFVPCYNKQSGVSGLINVSTGMFYTSNNGTLTHGADVN